MVGERCLISAVRAEASPRQLADLLFAPATDHRYLQIGHGAIGYDEHPPVLLCQGLEDGAGQPICRGFAIGRSIFAAAAEAWFAGHLDDAAAVTLMADTYRRLLRCWQQARGRAAEPLETIAR